MTSELLDRFEPAGGAGRVKLFFEESRQCVHIFLVEPFRSETKSPAGVSSLKGVPPRTQTEAELLATWSKLMPGYEGGVYGNFFEQGGDSLAALQLMDRLSRDFLFEADAAWLIEHATVAQMGEFFDRSRQAARRAGKTKVHFTQIKAQLVLLRQGEGERVWVIVPGGHAGEDELLNFARLARFIREPGEIHGLRFNLNDSKVRPPGSFEQVVKKVLPVLRDRLKGKKVILVGECLAGALAWDLAGRFRAKGGRVERVILLDPWRKNFSPDASKNWGGPAMNRYYELMMNAPWRKGSTALDVIFSESSWLGPERLALEEFKATCHRVSGDHHSYIRQGADRVAEILDRIAASEVVEDPPTSNLFIRLKRLFG